MSNRPARRGSAALLRQYQWRANVLEVTSPRWEETTMMRKVASLTAMALAIALGDPASAQYGGYGWGGWGGGSSTVAGDQLRGAGVFAAGAGQYNVDTAQARSINTQTAMQANEYLYESFQIARQNYYKKVAAKKNLDDKAIAQMEQNHLYNASEDDVINGDAMNAMLHQFANPNVPSSVTSNAGTDLTISGDAVKEIPFKFATDGIVISLDRLSAQDQWPLPLLGDDFAQYRDQYAKLVAEVKGRPEGAPVPDSKIVQGITILSNMRDKAHRTLKGRDFAQSENYLKGLLGMLQMVRQPDIKQVLAQASKFKTIPIANLVAFMEVFNLEFGTAKSPQEKSLYMQAIYPQIKELRDRVERELKAPISTGTQVVRQTDPQKSPTEVFHGVDWDKLSSTAAPVAVPPPGAGAVNDPQR
jgi:hypothetical protein